MKSRLKSQRIKARIGALRSRHTALDSSLESELGRPAPDSERVQMLKRMKLRTKDEIQAALGLLRTLGRPDVRVFKRPKYATS